MHEDLLLRSGITLTLVVLAASLVPPIAARLVLRVPACAAITAFGMADALDERYGLVVAGAIFLVGCVTTTSGRGALAWAGGLVVLLALSPGRTKDGWDAATTTDVLVVLVGAAVAVGAGGELLRRVLHPLATKVDPQRNVRTLEQAGRYIGWLERTLLYGLLVAGAPGAAALVVAIKSAARFPSFSRDDFAEYFLIGTLLSVSIAASCAAVVRAVLGLGKLFG